MSIYEIARSCNPVNKEHLLLSTVNAVDLLKKDLKNKGHRNNSMRNKKCLCSSGLKFKHCCWTKYPARSPKPIVTYTETFDYEVHYYRSQASR